MIVHAATKTIFGKKNCKEGWVTKRDPFMRFVYVQKDQQHFTLKHFETCLNLSFVNIFNIFIFKLKNLF